MSLREAAEAANGQGSTGPPDTVQESATAFAEFYRLADPPTVLALLDVVEAAGGLLTHYHGDFPAAFSAMQAALSRLPEEVRREQA